MVWFQKKDLFFDLIISLRERDGHCYCASMERIKPLWIDDLFGIEKFYECMDTSPYHQELRKSLSLIYEKKYEEALDYLSTQDRGHFCNKGVWINDAMRDYISRAHD